MLEEGRRKTWKPKVKTGCITCRIRKIKCDEAKPHCQRCTSTGRKCDGYQPQYLSPNATASLTVASRTPSPRVLTPCGSSLPLKEKESLHFFHLHTAPELAGFFDSDFWLRDISLYAHEHIAIHHAVTALGAMHRKLIEGATSMVPDNFLDAQMQFAIEQCTRAVSHIARNTRTNSREDKITAMIAAIVFACLSSMQGYQPQAITHLRGGLKLLNESRATTATDEVPPRLPVSLDTLSTMFTSLDFQARGLLNDDMLSTWEPRPPINDFEAPPIFKSLSEAHNFFEAAFNYLMGFLQDIELRPQTAESFVALMVEYGCHERRLAAGNVALANFLALPTMAKLDRRQQSSLAALDLCRCQTEIFMGVFKVLPEQGEMGWDLFETQFAHIVELCCLILDIDSAARPYSFTPSTGRASSIALRTGTSLSTAGLVAIPAGDSAPRPIFSFGIGVLTPLYLVASRSRNPLLRRKAVDLLLRHPRREGIWDSAIAGTIALECMMIEEEATRFHNQTGGGKAPEASIACAADVTVNFRVRDVAITYTGLRRAKVVIRTVQQFENGDIGIEKDVIW